MRLVAAVTAAFTFAVPARLHSQQHQPPPSATVVRDTLTGIVVAIDTMKATGMMGSMPMAGKEHAQAMKHDMGGTKPDSGGMKHDMGPMNHAEHHKMMTQGGGGLALRILAGHDTISAHLGPVWYLKQQNPDGFAIGDHVSVDGVAMKHDGKPRWAGAMMPMMPGMKKPPR